MKTFKIGKKEYEIRYGDYLLDNDRSIQFVTGDGRMIFGNGFERNNSIALSKTALKQFDMTSMKCENVTNRWGSHKRYYIGVQ